MGKREKSKNQQYPGRLTVDEIGTLFRTMARVFLVGSVVPVLVVLSVIYGS